VTPHTHTHRLSPKGLIIHRLSGKIRTGLLSCSKNLKEQGKENLRLLLWLGVRLAGAFWFESPAGALQMKECPIRLLGYEAKEKEGGTSVKKNGSS
jgi:hypothetical protein